MKERLKILFTHRFSFGGGLIITHETCNHLATLGHEVTCVYIKNKLAHKKPPFFNDANYKILWIEAFPVVSPWVLRKFLKAYLKQNPVHALISTGPEGLCIPQNKYFIHITAHHGSTYVNLGDLLINLKNLFNLKCWWRWFHKLEFYFDQLRLKRAEIVQCISYNQKTITCEILKLPENKVKVIYCGADIKKFFPIEGKAKRRILYCGGLLPNKGINILIEAFVLVSMKHKVVLDILGDGDWDLYRKKVEALRLGDSVCYHGHISYKQIGNYYRNAYLLVAPTQHEAFGLTIVEAMAAGLPVVATSVTAVPELVKNGETGILVPWGDPQSLAQAIITLLDNPGLAKSMGQAGRKWVEEMFTWDRAAKEMEKLIIHNIKN